MANGDGVVGRFAPAGGAPACGAVLRGVTLRREVRALAPPPAAGARPVEGVPAVAGAPPARARSAQYDEGFRAGQADAERSLHERREAAAKDGFAAGLERGFEEGRQRGHEEGVRAAEEAVARGAQAVAEASATRLAALERVLAELPLALESRLVAAEDDMVALAHAAVCRILGERLATREGVAAVVREALRSALGPAAASGPGRPAIVVHLHPRDLRALEESPLPEPRGVPVRWFADEAVGPGGCLVRTDVGTLDARLETQLMELRAILLRGANASAGARPAAPRSAGGSGGQR